MSRHFLWLFLFCSSLAFGQDYFFKNYAPFAPEIASPEAYLGYGIGSQHTRHDQIVGYLEQLAAQSDRAQLIPYGRTHEGRKLVFLALSSPKNLSRLVAIREAHLAQIRGKKSPALEDIPLIINLAYNVHGNEPSSSEAALLTAYTLSASSHAAVASYLEKAVIFIDPTINPDGRDRHTQWANTYKGSPLVADPQDAEHNEYWPGGRTNHYWFDLNRDWLLTVNPESQAKVAWSHKWYPNVVTDFHEMGSQSTYFFEPMKPNASWDPIMPKENYTSLNDLFAGYFSKALDSIGSLYFTKEAFDGTYPGYGSSYPDLQGGLALLFEQASSRGLKQTTAYGEITFPFTIRNQFTAALSTLEAARKMRVKILKYQQDFYKESRNTGSKKAIVFGDEKDAATSFHLAEVLKRHQIKIHDVKSDFRQNGKTFKKGYSYVIPMNQKNQRLVKAMFDVRTKFKDSLFYDVSAWTFNHAFGVDYADNVSISKAGNEITELNMKEGNVSFKSDYGYLLPWNEYYTPKALNAILQKGLRAKVSMKNFKNGGNQYEYGTIFIPVQNQKLNSSELFNFLDKIAKESHIKIVGVTTGLNDGIDLGSNNFRAITKPKVAMLVGNGIAGNDSGEIWHLFDQRFDMRLTRIDMSYFSRVDISKYTHIVIPSSRLDKAAIDKLKIWTRNGGVIVGYKNTAKWLASNKFINIKIS